MRLYDQHTHSRNSRESGTISSVEELCRSGMEAGLSGIVVTDHYDIRRRPREVVTEQLRDSVEEILQTRERLDDRFYLGLGIELGEGHHDRSESAAAVALGDFDLVLGSLHNLRDMRDFYYIGKDRIDKRGLFRQYLAEQMEMLHWGGYDVLAHLTYPFRYYMLGVDTPDIREFEEELRVLFTRMAEQGKGLEVNTSGLCRPEHGRTMPELWELRLFRACGGEIVTVGSDAHDHHHVGNGIAAGTELLREAGFCYQALYRQRKPDMIPI